MSSIGNTVEPGATRSLFHPMVWVANRVLSGVLRKFVWGLDYILRRILGIGEYSEDPDCILRIAKVRWPHAVDLGKGGQIHAGDWVGDLHLWNEHIPSVVGYAKSLATGARFRTEVRKSLSSLAVFIAIEPEMREVTAFHARIYRAEHLGSRDHESVLERQGFSVFQRQTSFLGRAHEFFELFLVRALVWVFNPRGLSRTRRHLHRFEVWISREKLLIHFGPRCVPSSPEKRKDTRDVRKESNG